MYHSVFNVEALCFSLPSGDQFSDYCIHTDCEGIDRYIDEIDMCPQWHTGALRKSMKILKARDGWLEQFPSHNQ